MKSSATNIEELDSNQINVPQIIQQHELGEIFFRARTIKNLLDLQNWNYKDFYTVPSYKIKNYGRLNKPHEEILYFSNNSDQTLEEINYNRQTPVVIAAYQTVMSFNSSQIAKKDANNHQSDTIVQQFQKLFQQSTTIENNKKTTTIRDIFYRINPIDHIQAWSYPIQSISEIKTSNYNLAIYPGVAKRYLQFKGAIVISKANKLGLKHIDFCFDQNYRLDYLKGYPELIKIFNLDKEI